MQLPKIRIATRAINIAGRYVHVASLCDCGKPATTVACFTIRDNEPTALLLCQDCAEEFAECEAGGDYLLITIAEVVKMARERQAPKKKYKTFYSSDRQKILTWLAAQPHPQTPTAISEAFGGSYHMFRSLLNRWVVKGLVEKVTVPQVRKGCRSGVGYRVAICD